MFGPYRLIKENAPRLHGRCTPCLSDELLCAPKQWRHYHSPDNLFRDKWHLSDKDVEGMNLECCANLKESHQLEEMTADGMAVDGNYMVACIARNEYQQGCKFCTLRDGYGLSEATGGPMSAAIFATGLGAIPPHRGKQD